MKTNDVIDVRGLMKSFGRLRALDGVDVVLAISPFRHVPSIAGGAADLGG